MNKTILIITLVLTTLIFTLLSAVESIGVLWLLFGWFFTTILLLEFIPSIILFTRILIDTLITNEVKGGTK